MPLFQKRDQKLYCKIYNDCTNFSFMFGWRYIMKILYIFWNNLTFNLNSFSEMKRQRNYKNQLKGQKSEVGCFSNQIEIPIKTILFSNIWRIPKSSAFAGNKADIWVRILQELVSEICIWLQNSSKIPIGNLVDLYKLKELKLSQLILVAHPTLKNSKFLFENIHKWRPTFFGHFWPN